MASDKFIESDTGCPHINPLIIASTRKHFRSPIIGCTGDGQELSFVAPIRSFLADAKIDKFYFSFLSIIENIFWLDVPMAEIVRMDVF